MSTAVLSNNLIQDKKAEAIKNQSLIKRISTRNLKLIDDSHVEVNGYTVNITKNAYKSLIKSLGLPQTFTNKLERLFNGKSKTEFINRLTQAIAASGSSSLNVLLSPQSKTIVGFTTASNIISNESFFSFTDKIIDGQGFDIVDLNNNPYDGSVSINAVLNNTAHEIKGLSNETFKSGLTITNTPHGGIKVSPYMNRLWCANGCTTSMAQESYQLNDLSVGATSHFFDHINELRKNHFIPMGIGDTIREANSTPASIAEMDRAYKMIEPFVGARAESIIPKERNYNAYSKMGVDLKEAGGTDKKMAQSNQSVWSLVNALTWTATNSDKVLDNNIQDSDRVNLQIAGGDLLSKTYDLKNRMRSPFEGLNSDDQIGLLLN
tara:strand:+ start:222 stop:1355 length:1134 start_codon:yes stop_codon:yes gene_type:complete